jgi:hypothetical protein
MREKLIELLECFSTPVTLNGVKLMDWDIPMPGIVKAMADHLIAHGVTVADINVGGKWIPVTERLPESGKCVLVCSKDGMVAEGSYKAYEKKWTQFRWNVTDLQNVTHWMPLPEPPKGE